MAIALLIENFLPINFQPTITNGVLISKIKTESGMPETCETNIEVPVTPPSIK